MRAGARPGPCPLRASHTRAVLSHEAVTTRVPSGLNCGGADRALMPQGLAQGLPAPRVPHPRGLVREAVTTRVPSGLNWAATTEPSWRSSGAESGQLRRSNRSTSNPRPGKYAGSTRVAWASKGTLSPTRPNASLPHAPQ